MLQMFQRHGSFRSEVVGGKLPAGKYLLRFAAHGDAKSYNSIQLARTTRVICRRKITGLVIR